MLQKHDPQRNYPPSLFTASEGPQEHLACLGEGKPGLLWQEVSGLYGQDHRECCWQIYFDNLAQQSAGLRALTGELRPSRASHLTY